MGMIEWPEREHLLVRADQERGVNQSAFEATLHHHRLTGRNQRAIVPFRAGIDQRAPACIRHDELVAVDFGDLAANGDDVAGGERTDRHRRRRRHRYGGSGFRHHRCTGRTAEHEKCGADHGKLALAFLASAMLRVIVRFE
ncbi:hypothetical protein [Sphingomonas sp. GC_Shp_3]|uniref:hypothetical protein n=1 Tax=Sphingomonas sp. GC_Shp_3 TaxID=2937383 RepID=UPI002269EE06|nr:hypothetical protein [Sphingomonas sp. GC_Shp_3]